MRARYQGCEFVCSDARRTGFADDSFDLAVDKGLFDSATAGTEGRAAKAKWAMTIAMTSPILQVGSCIYDIFHTYGQIKYRRRRQDSCIQNAGPVVMCNNKLYQHT